MRLYLVRHGVTDHNSGRLFMGHDPVPLSPEGRRQVERLARRLAGETIDRLVASDLARAKESAEILGRAIGVPTELHPALREIDVGGAKGLSYDVVAQRWPEIATGGCFPDGESFEDVADRATAYLHAEVIREGDETVLVVAHGGVIRGVVGRLTGRSPAEVGIVGNASLTILRVGSGAVEVVSLGDTSHLE